MKHTPAEIPWGITPEDVRLIYAAPDLLAALREINNNWSARALKALPTELLGEEEGNVL